MTKFIKLFLAVILLAGCSKKNDESNLTAAAKSVTRLKKPKPFPNWKKA